MARSTDKTAEDVQKLIDDATEVARDQLAGVHETLTSYTRKKPVAAVLSAMVVGIILGKLIL